LLKNLFYRYRLVGKLHKKSASKSGTGRILDTS